MGWRGEDASLENRRGNRFGRRVGGMWRKLHASRSYIVSTGHCYLAHSCSCQQPAWTAARSETILSDCNRHFHIYGELADLPSAPKSYGEKSDTTELRPTDRLRHNKQYWAVRRSTYSSDTKHLRRCGAKHGEPEYLRNQFC